MACRGYFLLGSSLLTVSPTAAASGHVAPAVTPFYASQPNDKLKRESCKTKAVETKASYLVVRLPHNNRGRGGPVPVFLSYRDLHGYSALFRWTIMSPLCKDHTRPMSGSASESVGARFSPLSTIVWEVSGLSRRDASKMSGLVGQPLNAGASGRVGNLKSYLIILEFSPLPTTWVFHP